MSKTATEQTADFPPTMALADQALYAAKAAGRDRVCAADALAVSRR